MLNYSDRKSEDLPVSEELVSLGSFLRYGNYLMDYFVEKFLIRIN